jgi:hypothetical protein
VKSVSIPGFYVTQSVKGRRTKEKHVITGKNEGVKGDFHQFRGQKCRFMARNDDLDSKADFHPMGERNTF